MRSLRVYERLLVLYPEDLRREFGADMVEAFNEDLVAARGTGGVLRVWRKALSELMRIAAPAWFELPGVMVPLLSAAIFAASQSTMIAVVASLYPSTTPSIFSDDALTAVGTGCVIAAVTSFVAIYRWKWAGLITLRLL